MFIWVSQIILYHLASEDASVQEPFERMMQLERRPERSGPSSSKIKPNPGKVFLRRSWEPPEKVKGETDKTCEKGPLQIRLKA
jgi:hypothetical protein